MLLFPATAIALTTGGLVLIGRKLPAPNQVTYAPQAIGVTSDGRPIPFLLLRFSEILRGALRKVWRNWVVLIGVVLAGLARPADSTPPPPANWCALDW